MSDRLLVPTTHVIFDLVQTLVELMKPTIKILQEIAITRGKTWEAKDIIEIESMSRLFEEFLASIGDNSYKDAEKFNEFKKLFFQKVFASGFQMMSGVEKLIKHLYDNNIPMAIATNGTEDFYKVIEATNGLLPEYFSHFVYGDGDPEVMNNKPEPDVYLVCAKRFKTLPKSLDSCVIFEDSLIGITGAVATGMKTVLVSNTLSNASKIITDKITAIVDSLDNFKPESVGLPPFAK